MTEAVIVAIITALSTVLVQLIIARANRSRDDIQRARRDQRLDDRLEVIGKKLDEHNGYARRFEQIEKDITKISKDIEFMKGKNR